MKSELRRALRDALERPHQLGTIGGDLDDQLAHCASWSSVLGTLISSRAIPSGRFRGVDLGTGGGLPGVALAASFEESHWHLVDMRAARAVEVERVVLRLGLGHRVEVVATEMQVIGHTEGLRESFDVAVARSFGSPDLTAECAAGVVRVGGRLVVSEPPATTGSDAENTSDRWPVSSLAALGFGPASLVVEGGHRFVVVTKLEPCPATIPRRPPRSTRGWWTGR